MSGVERAAERCIWTEQMGLPDELIERSRPQSVGQGLVGARRARGRRAHGASRPMTSTPGGGVKENRSGISFGFFTGFVKDTCVI